MRCILPVCTVIMLFGASALCSAAEPEEPAVVSSAISAFAGAGDARPVRVGEWVEYLVSFPTDPLEYSLQPQPSPTMDDIADLDSDVSASVAATDEMFFIEPSFEPEIIWCSLPLRLEIRAVEPNGCTVRMSFGSMRSDVFLPLEQKPGVPLHYDAPQPPTAASQYKVGDMAFSVETLRKSAPGLGFIRMGSPDLPFGLARFATDKVDIALIGMGDASDVPPFPLAIPDGLDPKAGQLYRE